MGTWKKLSANSEIPKQYLKGFVEFYKLKFKVDSRVLIPRPETELLVDEVIHFVDHPERPKGVEGSLTILDIGTGSGNIAISLVKNLPKVKNLKKAKIFATDISQDALDLAKENAKLNKIENRIFFIQSDLLDFYHKGVRSSTVTIQPDIIITNLPYIPRGRMPYLDPSVRDFEPWEALVGGADGFELYRKLFQQIIEKNLKPKLIVGEIDYTHEIVAIQEAKKYFPNAKVEVKKDLAQKPRILIIQP